MIEIEKIKAYFPTEIRENRLYDKLILKEYLELMVLNYLSGTPYIQKLSFIGGTNLRLIMGIDRFSEGIDFDCKDMDKETFNKMTDEVLTFLARSGFDVVCKDKEHDNLTAFRRSIYFPQLLFDLQLTGHREERFLLKIEAQDQGINYTPIIKYIKGCGLFFSVQVPPDDVLCSMKISAALSRAKGRDFYDLMFLLGRTTPNYSFLSQRCGIRNVDELKESIAELLKRTDLSHKKQDFEHLLFNKSKSNLILHFDKMVELME